MFKNIILLFVYPISWFVFPNWLQTSQRLLFIRIVQLYFWQLICLLASN
jgi:hypothetical protein